MSEYDVGYRKPPKSGQIRKGEVRNPNGRRGKTARVKPVVDNSDAAILKRIEAEMVEANGHKMTKRELAIRVLQSKSIKGDMQAWKHFEALRAEIKASQPRAGGGVLVVPADVPLEEWEASAAIQQAKYRERPNDYWKDEDNKV